MNGHRFRRFSAAKPPRTLVAQEIKASERAGRALRDCRFWRKSADKDPLPGWGSCRMNPPKVTYGFPDAHEDWWCGEFKPIREILIDRSCSYC